MEAECNHGMWDSASEVRRTRPRDIGLRLGSKANATTRCRIQPSGLHYKKLAADRRKKGLLISSRSSDNLTGLPKRKVHLLKNRSGSTVLL